MASSPSTNPAISTPPLSSNPPIIIDESLHTWIKSHPWTEWPEFVTNLKRMGYFDLPSSQKLLRSEFNHDDFRLCPKHFLQAAAACISYAKDHPLLIDSLSKSDIAEVVKFGLPSFFKGYKTEERMNTFVCGEKPSQRMFVIDGLSLMQMISLYVYMEQNKQERMKALARNDQNNASEAEDRAQTVDLMRYILKEVYNETFSAGPGRCGPAPYRNLLRELANETRVVQEPTNDAS